MVYVDSLIIVRRNETALDFSVSVDLVNDYAMRVKIAKVGGHVFDKADGNLVDNADAIDSYDVDLVSRLLTKLGNVNQYKIAVIGTNLVRKEFRSESCVTRAIYQSVLADLKAVGCSHVCMMVLPLDYPGVDFGEDEKNDNGTLVSLYTDAGFFVYQTKGQEDLLIAPLSECGDVEFFPDEDGEKLDALHRFCWSLAQSSNEGVDIE